MTASPARLTGLGGLHFHCPGCQTSHVVPVAESDAYRADQCWQWNGSLETPTLQPSILVEMGQWPPQDPATKDFARDGQGNYLLGPDGRLLGYKDMRCHSYATNGQIQFLPDSTHALAGQTVPLPPIHEPMD